MPPKKKPDTAGYQKLKKDLADQRPGQLYILHGEETYLRDYYLGRLREQLLSGGMGTFNFHQLEPKDMSPHALEEAIDCLPMMGERTMVQVTDFDLFKCGEKDREGYTKLFSQLPDYVCVVFVYDLIDYKGDARTKLAAAIKEHGTVANFVRQDQGDLVDWVRRRFRALGKDIDSRLALDMIFLCGDLMTNLIGEIEKVGAYARQKHITMGDIQAVATPQLDAVVFRMTDAIGEGKFDQAMSVLGGAVSDAGAPHQDHVVGGAADAAAVLRPPGPGAGQRPGLCGSAVGHQALPLREADAQRQAVQPEVVPPGGGALRPDRPGHEVLRPGRQGAAHRPDAGAGEPRLTAGVDVLIGPKRN